MYLKIKLLIGHSLRQSPSVMRSYSTSDKFSEREKGEESNYVRKQEQDKIRELKEKLEQQKKDVEQTQSEINNAEKK